MLAWMLDALMLNLKLMFGGFILMACMYLIIGFFMGMSAGGNMVKDFWNNFTGKGKSDE
jgi:hypothetical protein